MAATSSSDGSVTLGARVGWPGERPGTYDPARVENGAMRCIEEQRGECVGATRADDPGLPTFPVPRLWQAVQ